MFNRKRIKALEEKVEALERLIEERTTASTYEMGEVDFKRVARKVAEMAGAGKRAGSCR